MLSPSGPSDTSSSGRFEVSVLELQVHACARLAMLRVERHSRFAERRHVKVDPSLTSFLALEWKGASSIASWL